MGNNQTPGMVIRKEGTNSEPTARHEKHPLTLKRTIDE